MKKIYITIIILVFVGSSWYIYKYYIQPFNTLNNYMTQEYKQYKNDSFGLAFDYPANWEVAVNNEEDKNIKFSITGPDFAKNPTGQKLSITVIQFKAGAPYSVQVPTCEAENQVGTLIVNGKEYLRCNIDGEYRVGFQEKNKIGNELFFDISYDSTDPKNESTQTIEATIKSIKF